MNEHVGALKAYRHNVIVGYKKGGGEQSTPTEAKDSLRSKQLASVIDLLCEGPIKGVKGLTGIYLDGVPIYNDDGTANFTNISLLTRNGGPAQTIMPGFNANISPHSVGVPVKVSPPAAPQEILNTDVDHCRVTVSTPQLQTVNKQTGDINGSEIKFDIMLDNNGGGYALIGHFTISGKTSSNYQRAITFDLPKPGPWHVKVIRVTPDSTTQDVMNELHWDTYEEITDDKINYANSAVVGLKIDAEQFRSIPKRIYDVEGLVIRVPTTYVDPDNGVWSGVWDGTFKSAYSNNPAWCFYDLVTNNRYGLGDFISPVYVDKWALYKIGVWCDGRVPGKNGVPERRYQCNFLITNQQEAFNLLAQMVSIFRGWAMWTGGMMVTGCDMPEDVAQQFTNANVIDGVFNYSSTDIRQKHTQAGVRWSDPAQLGQQRLAIYDDSDALSRYGIQRADVVAYGCTRESEAIRAAKWLLYTEQYEDEQINFKTGHNGAYTRVGSIIAVMDVTI